MDYMVQHLLSMNGNELYKFEVDKTREWEENFYYTDVRLPKLETLASQFIFSKRDEIENILTRLVKKKFKKVDPCNDPIKG